MKRLLSFISGVIFVIVAAIGLIQAAEFFENPTRSFDETPATELTSLGSPFKIYFNLLTNIEKHAYNAILAELSAMPEKIKIPNLDGYELENVFSAILCDNPEFYFVARTCTLEEFTFKYDYFVPEYSMSAAEYRDSITSLREEARRVISSLTDADNHWLSELEIHDYLIENCSYRLNTDGSDPFVSSAYGAIVNGFAACEGYSKGAKLLLDMAGIENTVVNGDATNSEGSTVKHMWNAVRLSGNWYYLDCTWDDPANDTDNSIPSYSYFNVSTEMISTTHSNFSYDFECTNIDENYHVKTGTYFTDYNRSYEKNITDIAAKLLNEGNGHIELRFANEDIYEAALEDLFGEGGRRIDYLLTSLSSKTSRRFSQYFKYIPDDKQYVLTLVIELV